MPIEGSAGTLDIENATLRSNAIAVLTNLVAGNDRVRESGAPALEVYGDPSNGGNEARLELVSNTATVSSSAFTRLTSNAGVFSIETGTDASDNGTITFGGFANERMRIGSDGNVGIGTNNPDARLHLEEPSDISATTRLFHTENGFSGGSRGHFEIVEKKTGAGTGWSDFTLRLQRRVDVTEQGYIEFNPTGSNGDYGIAFGTGAVETMRLDALNGNVGIGTNNPMARCHVGGTILDTDPARETIPAANLGASANFPVTTRAWFGNRIGATGEDYWGLAIGTLYSGASYLQNLNKQTSDYYNVLLQPNGGNVGIGTTNPTSRLEVSGINTAHNTTIYPLTVTTISSSSTAVEEGIGTGIEFRVERQDTDNIQNECGAIRVYGAAGIPSSSDYWNMAFRVKSNDTIFEPMTLKYNGNVGIGTNDPGYKLHVNGDMRSTGRIIASGGIDLPSNYGYNAILLGTGDGASYTVHNIRLRTWWSFGVRDYLDNCRILFDARTGDILGTGTVGSTSDDRLKINEKRITRATDTILKLDPQLYHKTNKSSILPKEGESVSYKTESGLIAQDIWYDAPELRHLVLLGNGADPDIEKPYRNPDITIDPDYSGWGPEPATVNYVGLIPYLIKSVQEITTELPNVKTNVSNVNVSNVDNYHGLIVSANKPDVYISTSSYDTKCYGVVSEENVETINNEILINTSRDGKVWVIDVENLQSGDYITTSNVAGYGMKQSDDLVHNYTVAKILQDCDFNPTQVPIKRVMRETRDVTYYVRREYSDVPQDGSEAHIHDNKIVEIDEVYYTKSTLVQVEANKDYISRTFTPEITEEAYDALDESDRESYAVTYFNTEISEIRLEEYESLSTSEKEEYEQKTRRVRKILTLKEMKEPVPGHEMETRTEEVDVLDSNGQLVWEETGETRASYIIKYIDGAGVETDEANAVHRAALVNCKVVL